MRIKVLVTVLGAVMAAFLLSGCATALERGKAAMRKGKYKKAEKIYRRVVEKQADAARLPEWTGKKFEYSFNERDAAAGILGMAEANKAMKNKERAFYTYFHYVQFCLRHDIDFESEIESIRKFVKENQNAEEAQRFDEIIQLGR